MATVTIRFDAGNVPVVTGAIPPDAQTAISGPTATGFLTNQSFIVVEGVYCFGLTTSVPYTPLWRVVQAIDGVPADITFRRASP
jgi:hypothetical protein